MSINHGENENFMAQIYGSSTTNRYTEGPGALLDDSCQPGALAAANGDNKTNLILCIKKAPKEWVQHQLQAALQQFGEITHINRQNQSYNNNSHSSSYWFAHCKTFNDMEAIIKGMANNRFGMEVQPKTNKKSSDQSFLNDNNPLDNSLRSSNKNNEIDYSRRTIKKFITNSPYQSSKADKNKNVRRNRTSRGSMPSTKNDSRMNDHKKKAESVASNYNEHTGKIEKITSLLKVHGTCKLCGTLCLSHCERCGEYYCSHDCQAKHWPQHRLYCFKMPSLVMPQPMDSNGAIPKNLNSRHSDKKNNESKHNQSTDNLSKISKPNRVVEKIEKKKDFDHNAKSQSESRFNNKENNQNQKNIVPEKSLLVNKVSLISSPPPKAKIPKSGTSVILTYSRNSNYMVIRSAETQDHSDYINIIDKVNSSAKSCKPLSELPKEGSYCLAFKDNWYYRAEILKIHSENDIECLYIDFGDIENKKLSDLKVLSPEYYKDCRYPFEVRLKNCDDLVVNRKYEAYINNIIDNSVILKLLYDTDNYSEDGTLIVDLIVKQRNESVNQTIMKLLSFEIPTEKDPLVMGDNIVQKQYDCNDIKNLIVLDLALITNGLIVAIPEQYMEEVEFFNKQLKNYASKFDQSICPRPAEMCVAEYQGEWRRGKCFETVGDGYPTVEFIDYGDLCPIKLDKIRKYPKGVDFPCYTINCFVEGISEIFDEFNKDDKKTEKLKVYLETLIPLHQVIIPNKIVPDDADLSMYNIEMPDLLKKVINYKNDIQ